MALNPDKIEERIDRAELSSTVMNMKIGQITFESMVQVMEFAKVMSISGLAIPHHLRNNPGACLAITLKALRIGLDPFDLAEHSYSMVTTKKEKRVREVPGGRPITEDVYIPVETIAYDSFVIASVINAHAPIVGRMSYKFEGEGDAMVCTVSATLKDSGRVETLQSPTLGARKKAIGLTVENGKEKVKGSPLWLDKPQQQLGYDTRRDFCRLYFPEVLMGFYDREEMEEYRAEAAEDITPKPTQSGLAQRLAAKEGAKGRTLDPANIERALEHRPAETVDEVVGERREPETVAVVAEKTKRSHHRKKETSANETGKSNEVAAANGGGAGEAPVHDPAVEENPGQAGESVVVEEADEQAPQHEQVTVEAEEEPEETAPQAYAREFLEKIETHLNGGELATLDAFKGYKTDMRAMVDKLEGLSPDEMDQVRGRFSTMMLQAEKVLSKKKGAKR